MGTAVDTRSAAAATPVPAAESCRVPGWKVFVPGYHKGRYYSAADCARVVSNFQRLSTGPTPYLVPTAKMGHQEEQEVAASMGYPSCGTITACRNTPDGGFEIDIDDVPLAIGSEINAGRVRSGSVEFPPELSDPDDPSKMVAGPVLAGVAFLGGEMPAVKGNPRPRAFVSPPPKARYGDGRTVALNEKPEPWLAKAMGAKGGDGANLSHRFCELRDGRRVATNRIRFSEVSPVNRDQLLAQLGAFLDVTDPGIANLPDDAIAALVKQVTDPGFAAKVAAAAAPPADPNAPAAPALDAPGGDPPADPTQFATFAAEWTKKFGAMEATIAGLQKNQPAVAAAAAFSQDYQARRQFDKQTRAQREVDAAVAAGKIVPADKAIHVAHLVALDDVQKFANGAAVASPFDLAVTALHERTPTHLFRESILDTPAPGEIDAFARAALASSPRGRRILQTAATK